MFVPQNLAAPLRELEEAFDHLSRDEAFQLELCALLRDYAGRPTPLHRCRGIGSRTARIYLKREDLLAGGSQSINLALAQGLLARRMGKTRLLAETSTGQHGVATAMVGALLRLSARIYIGEKDAERQPLNVERMSHLGAEVVVADSGSRTVREAISEALRDWAQSFGDTLYVAGTAAGPHPFPAIAHHFQRVVGTEARAQIIAAEGRLPDMVIACAGIGSSSIGLFSGFLDAEDAALVAVEAAGLGLDSGRHSAALSRGRAGILHGCRSLVLQDEDGQILPSYSIAPGLDYPGVSPELAHLATTGRVRCVPVDDRQAIEAFHVLSTREGILPALESAHAVAQAIAVAGSPRRPQRMTSPASGDPPELLLVNLSDRGEKDLAALRAHRRGLDP